MPAGKIKVLPPILQTEAFIGAPNIRHFSTTLFDGVLVFVSPVRPYEWAKKTGLKLAFYNIKKISNNKK